MCPPSVSFKQYINPHIHLISSDIYLKGYYFCNSINGILSNVFAFFLCGLLSLESSGNLWTFPSFNCQSVASNNFSNGPFIICNFSTFLLQHRSSLRQHLEKGPNNAEPPRSQPHSSRNTPLTFYSHLLICHKSLLDVFHIVSRIEACFSFLEPTSAPTLIIFFADFGELVPWRQQEEGIHIYIPETMDSKCEV